MKRYYPWIAITGSFTAGVIVGLWASCALFC